MNTTTLRKASISYLLLPNILFMYGWFRVEVAVPAIGALCYLFYKELIRKKEPNENILVASDISFLLITGAILTFLSGCGGYSLQYIDWWAHNSKFHDLYTSEWPYYFPGVNRLVRYYFGYYLVPSFLFKIIGSVVPSIIFAWTCIGFTLGISWIYILIYKKKSFLIIALFLGGCGHIIYTLGIITGVLVQEGPDYWLHFLSLYDQMMWAPNQLIPSIILTSIIFYDTFILKKHEKSFFPISLTAIWATFPFVSICLIYAVLFIFFFEKKKVFNKSILTSYLVPIIYTLPILIYFSSGSKPSISGFIWDFESERPILARYILGIMIDVSIFYMIFLMIKIHNKSLNINLVNTLFTLFILMTFYRIGKWNDWLTKMNIPFITLAMITIFRSLNPVFSNIRKKYTYLIYGTFILGYLTLTFTEEYFRIRNSLFKNVITSHFINQDFSPVPYNNFGNFYNTMINKWSYEEAEQYMAVKKSFYERHIIRSSHIEEISIK